MAICTRRASPALVMLPKGFTVSEGLEFVDGVQGRLHHLRREGLHQYTDGAESACERASAGNRQREAYSSDWFQEVCKRDNEPPASRLRRRLRERARGIAKVAVLMQSATIARQC